MEDIPEYELDDEYKERYNKKRTTQNQLLEGEKMLDEWMLKDAHLAIIDVVDYASKEGIKELDYDKKACDMA